MFHGQHRQLNTHHAADFTRPQATGVDDVLGVNGVLAIGDHVPRAILALLQVGAGFLVLQVGSQFADGAFRMPLAFLVVMYMLHTTGELCMSPVGLSQMTKLSPLGVVSFMMAVWFMAVAIAQYIGGIIAGLTTTETVGGQVLDPAAAMKTSLEVFNVIGLVSIGIGVVFLLLSPWLKKWSHGSDDTDTVPVDTATSI